ncbi:AraC family transcriptional regulator [Paenibacillus arenilitoris]|uniref:Helix-turn-helix transcriptional regulator n=1 Tax=Paenibacillus arenilitoris TaxID=2772299 RepID=A0A927CPD1_9BACL|nr:AraC family transcriptional regulator [Paenibacillus arenilitoris]MBD2871768.1 helix-turn-helix transcriptional regulator [Paenibacillus arenilitoris]
MQEYDHEFADFIYYTPGDLDKEGRIWPVRAGRCIAKPHYKVGPKRIECYSFHFVREGRVRLEFDGHHVELQKDDMFCLFPGRTYYYCMLPSDEPLQMSWIAVDGDRVEGLLELAELSPDRPYREKLAASSVKTTADRLIAALAVAEKWNPAVSLSLQALVCELFAGLVPESATVPSSEPAGWIKGCMDYIELHATEGISVQQVAEFAGVNRSHFSYVFASQVGLPPMKYIQKVRMEKAKRFLRETDATITEIAFSLGYPSLYSFTRAFKIYFDSSPSTVRKARRAE